MSPEELTRSERLSIEAVRALHYGSVEIVVHDGRIVRIDKVEKLRLETDPESGGRGGERNSSPRERPERRSLSHAQTGES